MHSQPACVEEQLLAIICVSWGGGGGGGGELGNLYGRAMRSMYLPSPATLKCVIPPPGYTFTSLHDLYWHPYKQISLRDQVQTGGLIEDYSAGNW